MSPVYYTPISLPLRHTSSRLALEHGVRRGAMKPPGRILADVRTARVRLPVGDSGFDRTLVAMESAQGEISNAHVWGGASWVRITIT
jgi:hypothetical protein